MTAADRAFPAYEQAPLSRSDLRWRCDPAEFAFESTAAVEPIRGVVGQDAAVEALRFGLEVNAPGQNVFVRGLTGTGRSTLLRGLLESIRPDCPKAPDRCYVHNFDHPDRPRLLTLPRGRGEAFRSRIENLVDFIRKDLAPALSSDVMRSQTEELDAAAARDMEAITGPFNEELKAAGLTLVTVQIGTMTRPMILPLEGDEPVPPERIEELRREGKITEEAYATLQEKIKRFAKRLHEVGEAIQAIHSRRRERLTDLLQNEARLMLEAVVAPLRGEFPVPEVRVFLDAIIDDVVQRHLPALEEDPKFTRQYEVNVVLCHAPDEPCPVIVENAPSVQTLLGSIDAAVTGDGEASFPHMMIRPGSLLRADGGYLVMEARDLLTEPGAWRSLIRTLRTETIQMVPPEFPLPWRMPIVKPEPIPTQVKVILLGDAGLYYALDSLDADFPILFKVLADFETSIPRESRSLGYYAGVLARLCDEESLTPFDSEGVAALAEHGARIAAQRDKLTVRFGRLADLAREASFLATRSGQGVASGEHVREAIRRTKRRADLPSRHFRDMVVQGSIRIQTHGKAVGQINGLAVIQAGPLTYGFPTRITATIGPGTGGAINIEREAELSGAIHNKSFYILGGLLRYLLRTDHPLTFDASIAFEQSYGGIDGDSASGAEICCLLSALTDLPLRQDLAMTGAIDQVGNILPIGAVNEKIEGFYDTCKDVGLTGTQGVIIPQSNVGDLMLRPDVVDACDEGTFHVYAADCIHEAIGLFSGYVPGERDEQRQYPEASVLGLAVANARQYWKMATSSEEKAKT